VQVLGGVESLARYAACTSELRLGCHLQLPRGLGYPVQDLNEIVSFVPLWVAGGSVLGGECEPQLTLVGLCLTLAPCGALIASRASRTAFWHAVAHGYCVNLSCWLYNEHASAKHHLQLLVISACISNLI